MSHTYTEEEKKDYQERVAQADAKIKEVLETFEIGVTAVPAFQEIEGGRCVAVAVIRYEDKKYNKPSVLESNEPTPATDA